MRQAVFIANDNRVSETITVPIDKTAKVSAIKKPGLYSLIHTDLIHT
jgi:hypothetical protein